MAGKSITWKPLEVRFWEKVQKTETCWLWTGSKNPDGYGMMAMPYTGAYNFKRAGAHRTSWVMHFGEIPEGMNVLHKCDVRACVNPAHLWLGTQTDNMRDMHAKKRAAPPKDISGEKNPIVKLTWEKVRTIRAQRPGRTLQSLADEFGVCFQLISLIVNNKIWKESENSY